MIILDKAIKSGEFIVKAKLNGTRSDIAVMIKPFCSFLSFQNGYKLKKGIMPNVTYHIVFIFLLVDVLCSDVTNL
jgi:hypothetical protein